MAKKSKSVKKSTTEGVVVLDLTPATEPVDNVIRIGSGKTGKYVQALKYMLDQDKIETITLSGWGKSWDKIRAVVDIVKSTYYTDLEYADCFLTHEEMTSKDGKEKYYLTVAAISVKRNKDLTHPAK